jgi:small subunit ribosomal protein S18
MVEESSEMKQDDGDLTSEIGAQDAGTSSEVKPSEAKPSEEKKPYRSSDDRRPSGDRRPPSNDRRRGPERPYNGPGHGRKVYFRKKVCKLCVRKVKSVDYKDVDFLRRFVTDRGKILPRRITGTCAKHQRMLASAIKRARFIALLPFEANR